MVGTHKWLYAHYTHPDVILNQFINVHNWWLERTNDSMLIIVILNQFINVPIIDGWNAQMTLCSLHPPRRQNQSTFLSESVYQRHIESVYLRIIDGWNAQMTLCSLHPPRRHIESVYQRSYNWWLERTNDSMLITPTQTSYWISLSTFL